MGEAAELLEKELVYLIVGCAIAVHNELGPGLREKTYERALCVEFRHKGVVYSSQSSFPVCYRGEQVDEYIPDLDVESRVIVDTKTVTSMTDAERGQLLNYLRVTGRQVGVLLNFHGQRLEWERLVLASAR